VSTFDLDDAALQRRAFGAGLALQRPDPDSIGVDLVMVEGVAGQTLAGVAGGDCLGQDLQVALVTPLGSDVLNTRFGFDGIRVLTQGLDPWLAEELLRIAVMRAVSADPRVREVTEVRLLRDDPAARRWTVEVDVVTVLGDVRRAALGEVVADG
jgi:phage baseplate assembly protein W